MLFPKLREALSKITPGFWQALIQDADSGHKWFDIWTDLGSIAHISEDARTDEGFKHFIADAHFIALSRNELPQVLEALDLAMEALELYTGIAGSDCRDSVTQYSAAAQALAKIKELSEKA